MSLLGRMQQNASDENEDSAAPGRRQPGQPARRASSAFEEQREARLRAIKKRIQQQLIEEIRHSQRLKDKAAKEKAAKEKAKDKDRPPEPRLHAEKRKQALVARYKPEEAEELSRRISDLLNQIIVEEGVLLSRREHQQLYEQIVSDLLGYGPLEKLLEDEETTDIMVVGPRNVFIERGGRLIRTAVAFDDEEHLRQIIDRIISPLGRRVDETSPMVDARLPDGSRVHVVIPPLAMDGTCLTIRKFSAIPLGVADLISLDTAPPDVFEFLDAAVRSELNILISGGSGSGKTTLLNVLSASIPSNERIVTVENSIELQLQQRHVIRLEARPANVEGEGELTIRDLVINALRMRPDRVIVGEVRGGEAIDLLQAMNTGMEGSMSTIHANTPADALARMEVMCLMGKLNLPARAVREQIAAAIDLVIHMVRFRDGSRRIVQVSEVEGMEGDAISMADLFVWDQTGLDGDGRVMGLMRPTGIIPRCTDRIADYGIRLPPAMFGISSYSGAPSRSFKEFRPAPEEGAAARPEEPLA